MTITRSGPPTTHDSVMWRVPLSAPPSAAWQKSFQTSGDATSGTSASRVQFEHAALTFRSDEDHVPEWIASIDRWIAHANTAQADLEAERQGVVTRAREQSDARRQRASDANEKFKNL
jgi:predicted Zn-dependent peptidase